MLALLVFGIMGAGGSHVPAPGVLASLPALARAGVDPEALSRTSLALVGIAPRWTEEELVEALTSWRDRNQRALCGHVEAHELTGTPCSLAVGSPLDSLLDEVLAAWGEAGVISPPMAVMLYGSLPPHLAATHDLVDGHLQARVQHFSGADLAEERARLVDQGLSAASRWTPEAVARSLRQRTKGVDLGDLQRRWNPEGGDLRRQVMEGWIRPLGLLTGRTGIAEAEEALHRAQAPTIVAAVAPEVVVAEHSVLEPAEAVAGPPEPTTASQGAIVVAGPLETGPVRVGRTGFAIAYGGTRFEGMRGER